MSEGGEGGRRGARLRDRRWFRPLAIGLPVLLVLVLGLGLYLPWELSKVAVPDLRGQTLSQAAAELGALGLTLQAEDPAALGLAAFTAIDEQQPAAGSRVVPGSVIAVTGHPVEVAVPELSGMTLAAAKAALAAAGLSPDLAAVVVPDGLAADAATIAAALTAAGLAGADGAPPTPPDPSRVGEDWSIVQQQPAAGASATAGTAVSLSVGIPFVAVPDVGGQPYAQAVAALQAAGFATSGIQDTGVVTAQSPAAGTPWIPGAEVGATLQHYVRYEAEATTRTGWLQWQAPGSSQIQVDDRAALPWSKTWWDTTSYGHLVVAWKFVGSGTATCRIIVDGTVVVEQTFTGLTPNVTCG